MGSFRNNTGMAKREINKLLKQKEKKIMRTALFSVINGVYIVLGNSVCYAVWILKMLQK